MAKHSQKHDLSNVKVLLIEDDDQVRVSIMRMLVSLGFTSLKDAEGAERAIELVESFGPDVILADLRMKPEGGVGFVKALRADFDKPVSQTPVIMLTGYEERGDLITAMEEGISAFVVKPVSANDMYQKLVSQLGRLKKAA